ncbi:MAG: methylase, partial [Dehalococcoidia bacterium]|nr:methylase [Dehalococcoidia bacterium]
MKLTLIFPNMGFHSHGGYTDEGRMEPLPLSVLAALTPADVECVLYDDRMEDIPFDEPTDLVAISIEIYTARRSYEIAAKYRERGIPVIFGGMHVTLVPEEAGKFADSIYIGDAETGWAGVIEDFKRGELKAIYQAPVGVPQEGGIIPRRELYADKGYLPLS